MKKILIKIRTSIKFFTLVSLATIIIVGIVAACYKPIYSVTLNGELIGYCKQKSRLQKRIEEYIELGDKETSNVAFVQIDEMPVYDMCLLKRGLTTNDDEIFEKVKEHGVIYYKYYTVLEDNEEKIFVSDFSIAEQVLESLKEKDSDNIDNLQILEKYETELEEFVDEETAIATLYKEKVVKQEPVKKDKIKASRGNSSFSTSYNMSKSKVSLGIGLIKPIAGTITSRFGSVSSIRSSAHTGLDISASKGASISAAASGTVSWAGYKGSYGYLVVITHSNGVQTYYGHCSKLYVQAGQTVSQGESIAAVGSTGNSTGNHLHFEIRVNGVAYNPQNYLY